MQRKIVTKAGEQYQEKGPARARRRGPFIAVGGNLGRKRAKARAL